MDSIMLNAINTTVDAAQKRQISVKILIVISRMINFEREGLVFLPIMILVTNTSSFSFGKFFYHYL